MKDRIRTFLLRGGLKAAIAGICALHWSMVILLFIYYFLGPLSQTDLSPSEGGKIWGMLLFSGFFSVITSLIFGIPSYYLMKLVVPKSFQTGLYDFYTGFIAALVLPLLVWWAYF